MQKTIKERVDTVKEKQDKSHEDRSGLVERVQKAAGSHDTPEGRSHWKASKDQWGTHRAFWQPEEAEE